MRQQRAGFTLIEMLIAIGFSAFIITVAYQAFATITRSIAVVNAMDDQNKALTSGIWTGLQVADYWDLEASPEGPWFKHWTREARETTADGKTSFAPVVFASDMSGPEFLKDGAVGDLNMRPTQNPGVFLPHDPRSWYRDHLWGGGDAPGYIQPTKNETSAWTLYAGWPYYGRYGQILDHILADDQNEIPVWNAGDSPRLRLGDYGFHSGSEMRAVEDLNNNGSIDAYDAANHRYRPVDWDGDGTIEAWQEQGFIDWSDDGDADDNQDIPFSQANADPSHKHDLLEQANARPRAMHQIFQRLSYMGVAEYMPRGNPIFYQDQRGRPGDADSKPYHRDPNPLAPLSQRDVHDSYNEYFNHGRGNWPHLTREETVGTRPMGYLWGMGANDWSSILGTHYRPRADMGGFILFPHKAEGPLIVENFYSHYDKHYNESPFQWTTRRSGSSVREFMPKNVNFLSTTYLTPHGVSDGKWQWQYLKEADSRLAEKLVGAGASYTEQQLGHAIRSATDASGFDLPVCRFQFLRINQYAGSQINMVQLTVEDRKQGIRLELNFTPMGSSYRGARQHWAARHIKQGGVITRTANSVSISDDSYGNAPIGDFYVDY